MVPGVAPGQNNGLEKSTPMPENRMSSRTLLVEPTAPMHEPATGASARFPSLQGKVVGFIDNAKPNFDHLAAELGTLLTQQHGVARVLTHRKRTASLPVADDALEQLVAECDLVVAGSGD
jgi:hypothetical protein